MTPEIKRVALYVLDEHPVRLTEMREIATQRGWEADAPRIFVNQHLLASEPVEDDVLHAAQVKK